MSFGISKRSLPWSLMVSLPVAYRSPTAAPDSGFATHAVGQSVRRYDAESPGSHRGPLVTLFNTPTREPAPGLQVGFGNSLWSLSQLSALLPSVTQANFRFVPPVKLGLSPPLETSSTARPWTCRLQRAILTIR